MSYSLSVVLSYFGKPQLQKCIISRRGIKIYLLTKKKKRKKKESLKEVSVLSKNRKPSVEARATAKNTAD